MTGNRFWTDRGADGCAQSWQWTWTGRALPVSPDTATVMAGWDPDSTLWLTDVAREREGPRQSWHRAPHDPSWHQAQ